MYNEIEDVFNGEFKADNMGEARVLLKKFFKLDKATIEATIEEYGMVTTRAGGVAERFYAFCEEERRNPEVALGWLKAEAEESGSANILRNEKHYLKIAAAIERMWIKNEALAEELLESA